MAEFLRAALVGNPNCGKTTLFNALTGASLKTANYPGVTVEKKSGICRLDPGILLSDLPGTYSLAAASMEERVTRDELLSDEHDVIIQVADASSAARSLRLTLELLALGKPMVLALNMMDIAEKRGIGIDIERLEKLLGIPVIPVSARRRRGLDTLIWRVTNAKPARRVSRSADRIAAAVLQAPAQADSFTDKADAILTHPIFGIPIFLAVMAVIFTLTFALGGFLKDGFDRMLGCLADAARNLLTTAGASAPLLSLITDGIIAGVGGVLAFLPNIAILFLLLAILEDSGYMPRAAYLMDGLMTKIGLSGRACIPLLLGLGCTVPAVMAARTLETHRGRLRTILVTPFMSCSARLPVYVLLSRMFFGKWATLAAFSMYLAGLAAAIVTARVHAVFSPKDAAPGLIIELPDYRMPDMRTVSSDVRGKLGDYVTKAGTTVFLASIALWFLLHFGRYGFCADLADSFAASIAALLVPVMTPTGLGDWRLVLALIAGIAAKETVISALTILYGGNLDALAASGFTAANAYAMMIFVLLYIPCIGAIAAIRRESGSSGFTLAAAVMQLTAAWLAAVIAYNCLRLIL